MTPEDILKEQNIQYTTRGKSHIISCLSPKHDDEHPSMFVDKTTGLAHCFSCGKTLNIFNKFNKIVNSLTVKQQRILSMINALHVTKLDMPKDATDIKKPFREVGIETFKHFNVFTSYSRFEGRIVLPITNFKNDIVAFVGRYQYSKLDPKYLVYPSGHSLPLFPPATSIKSSSMILVEGMFDLLNLYDKGIDNAVTSFGLIKPDKKDKFNNKLQERFMPYKIAGINTLYIMYDGDKRGRKAAHDLAEALEDFISVKYLAMEDGKDPGDLTKDEVDSLARKMREKNE